MLDARMSIRERTTAFCDRFGLRVPILLAPMAGASAPALSIAVASTGGLGACGALLMTPPEIAAWANEVRAASNDRFQINLWIPDPAPGRDADHEAQLRNFLSQWGPAVAPHAGDATPPDFSAQFAALLEARAPYPVQRGLTAAMRVAATKAGDLSRMQAWAGQSAHLARAEPARVILQRLWDDAVAIVRY